MKNKYLLVTAIFLTIITLYLYMPDIMGYFGYLHNDESSTHTIATPSPNSITGNISPHPQNTNPVMTSEYTNINTPTPNLPMQPYDTEVVPECKPENFSIVYDVIKNDEILTDLSDLTPVSFPITENYTSLEGITCFRGNNYRSSASYGFVDVVEEKLEEVWTAKVGYIGTWTGVGWTGQPAIVKWDDKVKNIMNINADKKQKTDLKEVIYATLDGKIYFLDLDDGVPTRSPINSGAPFKGSVMVDPRGYPLLYAGEGIPHGDGKIGYKIFDLINQSEKFYLDGLDKNRYRSWGAFDSNGLLDASSDTLIECGENGLLYRIKLNTQFDPDKGNIFIDPETITYRYKPLKNNTIGVESSPVYYKNYIFFVDNAGYLQCVDLNTLKPVWIRNVTDDTDSTMVLEDDGTGVFLYTACEVDLQGSNGYSYIRKINALTGKLIWEKSYKCVYDSLNGGALASPVLGKGDISNLVIFNIAKTDNSVVGKIVALYKDTGEEAWCIDHPYYCWSSPVDLYTKGGKSYLIICDSGAFMHLLDGISGDILDTIAVYGNVEASPAIYDDMIVVGTRGQLIWGIRIK